MSEQVAMDYKHGDGVEVYDRWGGRGWLFGRVLTTSRDNVWVVVPIKGQAPEKWQVGRTYVRRAK